jgi:hypothetical protein
MAMLKISDAAEEVLYENEVALIALSEGYLNLSAYAASIRKQVEIRTKKPVRPGSIVVALSRLRQSLKKGKGGQSLLPEIRLEDLSVKSQLVELAFDRTKATLDALERLSRTHKWNYRDLLMIVQGIGEINIIVSEGMKKQVMAALRNLKPKLVLGGLASLSVRFDERYITTPNVIYGLVRHFAVRRINIIEIVSTFTELSFVVQNKDLEPGFGILSGLLDKNKDKKWSEYL